MNKEGVVKLRADLTRLMSEIELKYGVNISIGTIRYDATSFRFQVSGLTKGAPTEEESYYDMRHRMNPKIVPPRGTVIEVDGDVLQITGWKKSRRKFPISTIDLDGKRWKFSMSLFDKMKVISYPDGYVEPDEIPDPLQAARAIAAVGSKI